MGAITFLMDKDPANAANAFYANAKGYFSGLQSDVIEAPAGGQTLEGVFKILRDRAVRPVVAHQSIGARPATATERRQLRIRGNEPVLTMTRSAFDALGKPVEYGDHCYRAASYSIEVMVDER